MVYIGIKIIYYAFKLNTENLKEVLTKNGVEIIVEIFNLILKNSFSCSGHLSRAFKNYAAEDSASSASAGEENIGRNSIPENAAND
jgi:hypothetical protein